MHDVCGGRPVTARRQTSHPTVQKQRDTWVVCVDGIGTVFGARKPRQLGTVPSRRSPQAAASAAAAGDAGAERDTVAAVVDRWVAAQVDVSNKSRLQYEWAADHIKAGLGGVRLDSLVTTSSALEAQHPDHVDGAACGARRRRRRRGSALWRGGVSRLILGAQSPLLSSATVSVSVVVINRTGAPFQR
jgi:hypothetical protein